MRVHERRQRVEARRVDDLGALGRLEPVTQLGDPAVAHEHVGLAVEPGARIHQVGAADQQRRRRGGRAVELERSHAGCGAVVSSGTGETVGAPRPASSS